MIISDERLVELAVQADSITFRATGTTTNGLNFAREVFKVLVAQEPERAAQAERDATQARIDKLRDVGPDNDALRRQLTSSEAHRPGRAL